MPGHSTCDHVVTLNNIAQRKQDYRRPTFAAYIDLRAAFDSLRRPARWSLLTRTGIPDKIVRLIRALYDNSISCVQAGGVQSSWSKIESGVRQGCLLAPDSYTSMDWMLERTVGQGMNGVWFGQDSYTDLDFFADDVSLLAELPALLGIKWHQFVRNEEARIITKNLSDNPVTASFHILVHGTYG